MSVIKRLTLTLICVASIAAYTFSSSRDLSRKTIASATPSPTPVKRNQLCNCPTISIASSPETVRMGDTVEFYINSNDKELLKRNFEWTISRGKIISGQGTPRITVQSLEFVPTAQAEPSPTPDSAISPGFQPSEDPHSIIITGPFRPRGRELTITVKPADSTACDCLPANLTIKVGFAPQAINYPANVEELKLDKTKVILPCEPGRVPDIEKGVPDPIVNVTTAAKDPENDVLSYHYTVSGGKIIGSGANVQWDLRGVPPGTYTITAGVDDGCGICGKTMTQTVTAEACTPQCFNPSCPTLSLTEGKTDNEDEYVVTANISGGSQDQPITYQWTVTNGQIVSGQGTPSVIVKAWTNSRDVEPTVKVKIGGLDPYAACIDEASISIPKN
jgi:hypothetical protein